LCNRCNCGGAACKSAKVGAAEPRGTGTDFEGQGQAEGKWRLRGSEDQRIRGARRKEQGERPQGVMGGRRVCEGSEQERMKGMLMNPPRGPILTWLRL